MLELADIIAPAAPPPAPPPYGWIALGLVSLALILFFLLRLWLKRTRARRLARTALKRAGRALQRGQIDTRAAAFQAGMALRLAYRCLPPSPSQGEGRGEGQKRSYLPPLPTLSREGRGGESSRMAEWTNFMLELDRARYSPHAIDTRQASRLLAETRHWIERAP
ncbi:MAG: DUF4381 family protein [Burkholderiales bacterium]